MIISSLEVDAVDVYPNVVVVASPLRSNKHAYPLLMLDTWGLRGAPLFANCRNHLWLQHGGIIETGVFHTATRHLNRFTHMPVVGVFSSLCMEGT